MILATTNAPATISGPQVLAAMLMLAGVVMLGFVMVITIRTKIARRRAATPTTRERISAIHSAATQREDAYAVEAQMLDSARRIASQIDARAAALEHLIAHADARIAHLEALRVEAPVVQAPVVNAPVVEAENVDARVAGADVVTDATSTGAAVGAAAHNAPETRDDDSGDPFDAKAAHVRDEVRRVVRATPVTTPESHDELAAAVYALADQGRASVDIARELDEQIGKVELILALREGAA